MMIVFKSNKQIIFFETQKQFINYLIEETRKNCLAAKGIIYKQEKQKG